MELFISVEEARRIILDAVHEQPSAVVDFEEALGLTLAEPIVSKDQIPPFANSAMDGFAVIASDVLGSDSYNPIELKLVGEVYAGQTCKFDIRAAAAKVSSVREAELSILNQTQH